MPGYRLIDSGGPRGRIVLATRSYAVGEVVLTEEPLIVFQSPGNLTSLLAKLVLKFLSASDACRAHILDLVHPLPLDGPHASPRVIARLLHASAVKEYLPASAQVDVNTIHKLILIVDTNAHAFNVAGGMREGACSAAPGSSSSGSTVSTSALFLVGSKAEHSCQPNVCYDSTGQLLVYRAIRPIAPGDAISHAYVNHTLPTLSRRALLYAGKDFVCMCCVCLGPDFARPLLCGGASSGATGDVVGSSSSRDDSGQCRGTMLNTDAGTDEPDVWHCSHCGPRSDAACSAALALEAALEARLRVMQRDDCPASSLADIHALAAEASASLSPEHSLVGRALSHYSAMSAGYCQQAALTGRLDARTAPFSSLPQLHFASATATLLAVDIGEGIAARASGGSRGGSGEKCRGDADGGGGSGEGASEAARASSPSYGQVHECAHALLELEALLSDPVFGSDAASLLVLHFCRYRPLLCCAFGADNEDVERLDAAVAAVLLDAAFVAGRVVEAFPLVLSAVAAAAVAAAATAVCPCGLKAALKCSRCLLAGYCGASCQKAAWAVHRKTCRPPSLAPLVAPGPTPARAVSK